MEFRSPPARRQDRPVGLPDDAAVAAAVSVLANEMVSKIAEAAQKLFTEFDPDSPADSLMLYLTQLQIMDGLSKSSSDYTGVVAAARRAGGTWEQIGATLGMTKQAAYERWSKQVKTLDAGAEWSKAEAEKPTNPLVEYAPMLHLEKRPEQPRRRRRRT